MNSQSKTNIYNTILLRLLQEQIAQQQASYLDNSSPVGLLSQLPNVPSNITSSDCIDTSMSIDEQLKKEFSATQLPFVLSIPPRDEIQKKVKINIRRKYNNKKRKSNSRSTRVRTTRAVSTPRVLYDFDRPRSHTKKRPHCEVGYASTHSTVHHVRKGNLVNQDGSIETVVKTKKNVRFLLPIYERQDTRVHEPSHDTRKSEKSELNGLESVRRDCVQAIFTIGLQNCTPKLLQQNMSSPNNVDLETLEQYLDAHYPEYSITNRSNENVGINKPVKVTELDTDDYNRMDGTATLTNDEHLLMLPILSEEEKASSIGASYRFLEYFHHSLHQKLESKRQAHEIEAALGMLELST